MTNYTWDISPGGSITGGSGDSWILVSWFEAGMQWVEVNYTNPGGCTAAAPTQFNVTVNPLPDPAGTITGTEFVCAGVTGIDYSVAPISNSLAYVWMLPVGAAIDSGYGTNNIIVDFNVNASSGTITVYGNNLCGNGAASPDFIIGVYPIPATPVITLSNDTLYSNAPAGNQWYFNNMPLPGETGETLIANQTGWYWNAVTLNGCISDTSNNIYVLLTGLETPRAGIKISIYPVPNDGLFTFLSLLPGEHQFAITVYNILGEIVRKLKIFLLRDQENKSLT